MRTYLLRSKNYDHPYPWVGLCRSVICTPILETNI